jgi:hypothetical protein
VHKLDHLHGQPELCPFVANKVLDSFHVVVGGGLVFLARRRWRRRCNRECRVGMTMPRVADACSHACGGTTLSVGAESGSLCTEVATKYMDATGSAGLVLRCQVADACSQVWALGIMQP